MLSVQTNMLAENAARQLGINTKKREKNTGKFASGYKINRAADDAAGLSISEKMRRQVRGLRMGKENITDGISCVQIAEGSLNEICDMLHRINELSIKAYNGTNQEEDRKYIQAEINQLIDEIDRTAEATTFNEIPLLKGDPCTQKVSVEILETTTETRDDVYKDLPAWLKNGVDEELKVHSPAYVTDGTQDMTGYMLQSKTLPDGKLEYHYYGPANATMVGNQIYVSKEKIWATYEKAWTPTVDDNPTAKIDFKGLVDGSPDAETLYNNMLDLLGASIGVPCGTCNDQYYGINFTGREKIGENSVLEAEPICFFEKEIEDPTSGDKKTISVPVKATETINLSEWKEFASEKDSDKKVSCFERIQEMIERHKGSGLTDDQKKTEVEELAKEIAKKLCAETLQKVSNNTDNKGHFDRAIKVKDDDYSFIVYDYRDDSTLTALGRANSKVYTSARCHIESVTQQTFFVDGFQKVPLEIQASEKSGDRIPILLPVISKETLGIRSYDVSRYEVKETYTEQYLKKLDKYQEELAEYEKKYAEWEKECNELLSDYYAKYNLWRNNCPKEEKTIKSTVSVWAGFEFINGEKKPKYNTEEREEKRTFFLDDGNAPTKPVLPPQPQKPQMKIEDGDLEYKRVYDPDNNKIIGDALQYVLQCRTVLGATQNRLEHAYNIDANSEENTQAAESRIRDTDIAKEMVEFSNNSILLQAGVSMMAHANQDRQSILSLLQ